ncbi:MAG: T9SS type A sorting domain-containing protein [Flavobacteriales bacterium]
MMKHLYSFFTLICFSAILSAQTTTNVTFSVDMSSETVSADGVHVAGDFQGWDPASSELTDDDMDGVYTLSIDVAAPALLQFKFINGNSWDTVEDVPDACQVEVSGNDNRFLFASGQVEVVEYHVCYGSCAACGLSTVRFRVDMSQESVSASGVHVAGDFQGWDPSTTELFDVDGDMVYETIQSFIPDTTQSVVFKFVNGNSWIDPNENLSAADCEDGNGNRVLTLDSENVVMSVAGTSTPVCYNNCESCVSPTSVTLRVDMTTQAAVSVNGVHVAGNFQGWSPGASPLSDDDGDGIWEVVLEMAPGSYEFKFINGNDWGGSGEGNIDNENPAGDCISNGNRVLEIGEEAVVYEACYNNCPGVACMPDPIAADVTFRVNMADEETSADGVFLIGSFTDPAWQSGSIALSDADGDDVWEVTTEVSGPAELFYKFTNGDPLPGGEADYTVEESGISYDADSLETNFEIGGCGVPNGFGAFNRLHTRSGDVEILDIVCYNLCADCGTDGIHNVNQILFNVYPNPADNHVIVSVNSQMNSAAITITDSSGRVVYQLTDANLSGHLNIDISDFSQGLYQITLLSSDNLSSVKRLVIQ